MDPARNASTSRGRGTAPARTGGMAHLTVSSGRAGRSAVIALPVPLRGSRVCRPFPPRVHLSSGWCRPTRPGPMLSPSNDEGARDDPAERDHRHRDRRRGADRAHRRGPAGPAGHSARRAGRWRRAEPDVEGGAGPRVEPGGAGRARGGRGTGCRGTAAAQHRHGRPRARARPGPPDGAADPVPVRAQRAAEHHRGTADRAAGRARGIGAAAHRVDTVRAEGDGRSSGHGRRRGVRDQGALRDRSGRRAQRRAGRGRPRLPRSDVLRPVRPRRRRARRGPAPRRPGHDRAVPAAV